jgi:hypothetical protein
MKTSDTLSTRIQGFSFPEEFEAWTLEDFSDLSLPRKALMNQSLEVFWGRSSLRVLK